MQILFLGQDNTSDLKEKDMESELLEYGKRLFAPERKKILKPLATSRKRKFKNFFHILFLICIIF